jgi:hypothetical protein
VTPTTAAPAVTAAPTAEVLGLTESKPAEAQPAQPGELAFTGANLTTLLTLVGGAMVMTGMLLTLAARRQEQFS